VVGTVHEPQGPAGPAHAVSRLRTAAPGTIRVLFEDVSINGVRLRSEKDFPNGLETQGDVRLEFR
jgi:hypothetical protein